MSIPKFEDKDRLPVERASGMQNPSRDRGVLPGHLRHLLAPLSPAHHKWTDGPKLKMGQQISPGVFPSWTEGKRAVRKKVCFFQALISFSKRLTCGLWELYWVQLLGKLAVSTEAEHIQS